MLATRKFARRASMPRDTSHQQHIMQAEPAGTRMPADSKEDAVTSMKISGSADATAFIATIPATAPRAPQHCLTSINSSRGAESHELDGRFNNAAEAHRHVNTTASFRHATSQRRDESCIYATGRG
jgi:hypothetical protein